MKKIIALLLVLVMVLGVFAGCSPAKKDNEGTTNPSEGVNGEGSTGEGGGNAVGAYKFGLNIANPIKLISLFVGSEPTGEVPDIENVYFEALTDIDAQKSLATFGANLFDKDYALNVFGNANSVVISAPALHGTNYGMSYEELMTLYSGLLLGMGGMIAPDMAPDMDTAVSGSGMVNITTLLPLLAENSETLGKMVDKYVELLITEIKANAQVTEAADGSNTKTTYTLNADSLGMITANVLDAFFTDTEAVALLKKLGVDTDEIVSTKPSKAELQETYKQMFVQLGSPVLTVALTTDAAKALVAIDADLVVNQAAILTLDYDKATGTFSAVLDDDPSNNNKTTITGKVENGTTAIEIIDIASFGDGITYTDTTNISFGETGFSFKTVSSSTDGMTTTLDISLTIAETSVDFRAYQSSKNPEEYAAYDFESEIKASLTWSDTGFTIKLNIEGTETVVTVSDKDGKVEGKLTMDGEEMGNILFDKSVDGSKTTYTLKSLTYGDVSIDFSDVGLSFYYETGISVPDAPTNYTNLAELDEDALQGILTEIMEDNEELISKFIRSEAVPSV